MEPSQILRSITVPVELAEFRVAGNAVAVDDRRELLKALRAGDVFTLSVQAKSYVQPRAPLPLPKKMRSKANANFARFKEEELAAFAASFTGRRFLRDHNRHSMASVGGTITKSEVVETASQLVFRQELELVKPWAIEDALDGTMQTFSIGWDPKVRGWEGYKASLLCSLCLEPMISRDCAHWPGQEVRFGKQDEVFIVEALWTNVVGAETSEVAFPAVTGTKVEDVRAALSEARSYSPKTNPKGRPMDEILKALGLSEDANTSSALEAIAALSKSKATAETELAAERKLRAAAEENVGKERQLRVQSAAAAKAAKDEARKTTIAALRDQALAEGRSIDGSGDDELFLELAEESVDRGRKFFNAREPGNASPVGQPMQNRTPAAPAKKGARKLSKSERAWCSERGMSEDEYLKYAYADDEDNESEDAA